MGVEVIGGREVAEKLQELGANAAMAVYNAVAQCGEAAAGYARMKAPVGQSGGGGGHLGQSIHSQVEQSGDTTTAIVYTPAPHAQYVEFGTGWPIGHNVMTPLKNGQMKPGWRAPINGSVRWITGMAPRPFMKPAMEYAERDLRARIQAALEGLGNG